RRDRLAPSLGGGEEGFRTAPRGAFGLEEAGVVDRDGGLAGDRFHQALMFGTEWLLGAADEDQGTQQVVLRAQRRGEHRLSPALGTGHLVAGVFRGVLDQRRCTVTDDPADDPLAHLEALHLFQRYRDTQGRFHLQLAPGVVEQKDGGGVEGNQGIHPLQDLLERAVEVERGAERGADLRQQAVRGGWSGTAARDDTEPARFDLTRTLRHGPHNR